MFDLFQRHRVPILEWINGNATGPFEKTPNQVLETVIRVLTEKHTVGKVGKASRASSLTGTRQRSSPSRVVSSLISNAWVIGVEG